MIFRALTSRTASPVESAQDWTFGAGKQGFLEGSDAIALAIETALKVYKSECFWNTDFGVDWWGLLGSTGQERIKAAIVMQCREVVLGVPGVQSVISMGASIDSNRRLTINWEVSSIFSTISNFTLVS